jgi:hypothetical protein
MLADSELLCTIYVASFPDVRAILGTVIRLGPEAVYLMFLALGTTSSAVVAFKKAQIRNEWANHQRTLWVLEIGCADLFGGASRDRSTSLC